MCKKYDDLGIKFTKGNTNRIPWMAFNDLELEPYLLENIAEVHVSSSYCGMYNKRAFYITKKDGQGEWFYGNKATKKMYKFLTK